MRQERSKRATLTAILATGLGACGARDGATAPSPPTLPHATDTAASISPAASASAEPADGGPLFACRGPLPSCVGDPCPGGLACVGEGNVACGDQPALGKPCPAGTCELAGADLGARVCLPAGCCAPKQHLPQASSCEQGEPSVLVEIERGAARESWLTCVDSASGRRVNDLALRDGTRVIFTFSAEYAEHVGEARPIRGFLKPPHGRLGGALVAFGAGATDERNPYDQERIVARSARVLEREPASSVEGSVAFGERGSARAQDLGQIAGESLPADGLGTSACGTDLEDTFTCSALIGTDPEPTWLFAELDAHRALVDAFVAWSRPAGADIFVASRAKVDAKGRLELGDLRRLAHVDDAQPGDALVRVTIDH